MRVHARTLSVVQLDSVTATTWEALHSTFSLKRMKTQSMLLLEQGCKPTGFEAALLPPCGSLEVLHTTICRKCKSEKGIVSSFSGAAATGKWPTVRTRVSTTLYVTNARSLLDQLWMVLDDSTESMARCKHRNGSPASRHAQRRIPWDYGLTRKTWNYKLPGGIRKEKQLDIRPERDFLHVPTKNASYQSSRHVGLVSNWKASGFSKRNTKMKT